MCLRWTAAGVVEAELQFGRVVGRADLAKLAVIVESDVGTRRAFTSPPRRPIRSSPPDRSHRTPSKFTANGSNSVSALAWLHRTPTTGGGALPRWFGESATQPAAECGVPGRHHEMGGGTSDLDRRGGARCGRDRRGWCAGRRRRQTQQPAMRRCRGGRRSRWRRGCGVAGLGPAPGVALTVVERTVSRADGRSLALRPAVLRRGRHWFRAHTGTLVVPENRRAQSSRTLRLPVLVFRGRAQSSPPIVYMHGGPGMSNVRFVPPRWLLENTTSCWWAIGAWTDRVAWHARRSLAPCAAGSARWIPARLTACGRHSPTTCGGCVSTAWTSRATRSPRWSRTSRLPATRSGSRRWICSARATARA